MRALVVLRCGPGASIQDLGRPGHLHEGLAPGGALDRESLAAANESLGNPREAAAIELCLHGATFRAEGALTVSIEGAPRQLEEGETLEVPASSSAVRYVALPGGVDVPLQLGARATLVAARLGGLEGRFLRAGDRVDASAPAPARELRVAPPADDGSPIRVVPGPDALARDALDVLISAEFRISPAFDRVGVRLEGPKLATLDDRPYSTPMVRGAIQVAHDGTPIVLGPDHPTTGGYPVLATVVTVDLGRLARRRPGVPVRFRLA